MATQRRILILGAARSGTTWLGRTLDTAPGVRYVFEPDQIQPRVANPGADGLGPYPVLHPGEKAQEYSAIWDLAFNGALLGLRRSPVMITGARAVLKLPRAVRAPLASGAAALITKASGPSEWNVVKSIFAHTYLDWVMDRYDPVVVVTQRHPMNVVASWLELDIPTFDIWDRPDIRREFLERFDLHPPSPSASRAGQAAWCVGFLTFAAADALSRLTSWTLVTHDNLCMDVSGGFRSLFSTLGMPWTTATEEFLAASNRPGEGKATDRVAADQPERWRQRLSDAEVEEAQAALEQFPGKGWVQAGLTAPLVRFAAGNSLVSS